MLHQYYLDIDCLDAKAGVCSETLLNKVGVLAVISFDEPCAVPSSCGVIPIGAPSLSAKPYEVIAYGDQVAERGLSENCHWSVIGDICCAATWISADACADIEQATEAAYNRLLNVITLAGFPYPFRIWNFIPSINAGDKDQEAYKKFCVGRQRAFHRLALLDRQYPAASAVGLSTGSGGVIYLLATRKPSQHHENPRQQPAYQYPREYGPSSPSFARATSLLLPSQRLIFISGTASIIGHATTACGSLENQLEITLENIRCLLKSIDPHATALDAIRVYLRHPQDFAATHAYLAQQLPADSFNIIQADICRENLLVEIEAVSHTAIPQ